MIARAKVEPESSVLGRVRDALRAAGVYVMRNNVGRRGRVRFGLEKGSADLICVVPPYGRLLCVETKRPKGAVVADEQTRWLETMRRLGAVAGVCTTPEEALALVEEARRG